MTEEQQELYDIVSDWWDEVFCNNPAPVDRDSEYLDKNPTIIDLVNAIIDWKDPPQQHPEDIRVKECDIVRYAPNQAATYKYFMYSEKNK